MRRRRSVPTFDPLFCVVCGGPLSERRPATLIAEPGGTFKGPYHMGCAEKLVVAYQRGDLTGPLPGRTYGHDWTAPREETTPW